MLHYNFWDDPGHPEVWYWDESGEWFGKGHLTSEYFHERAIEHDGNLDDPDLFCRVKHAWATNEEDGRFDVTTWRSEEFCNPVTLGEFPSFYNNPDDCECWECSCTTCEGEGCNQICSPGHRLCFPCSDKNLIDYTKGP